MTVGPSLLRLRVLIALLSPTTLFRAELLIARYAARVESSSLVAVPSVMVCTLFSYSASVNGLIVSISSIDMSLRVSATWKRGDWCAAHIEASEIAFPSFKYWERFSARITSWKGG